MRARINAILLDWYAYYLPDEYLRASIDSHDLQGVRTAINYGANLNGEREPLRNAIEVADIVLVTELVNSGAQITGTLMSFAVSKGSQTIVTYLINQTPQLDASVHFAELIRQDNLPLLQFLLSIHANVNEPDELGNTPLLIAVANKNLPIVKILFENGANLNQTNNKGISPLLYAAKEGATDIIEFLMDHGANFTVQDNEGRGLYQHAANYKTKLFVLEKIKEKENRLQETATAFELIRKERMNKEYDSEIQAEKAAIEITKVNMDVACNAIHFQTVNALPLQYEQLSKISLELAYLFTNFHMGDDSDPQLRQYLDSAAWTLRDLGGKLGHPAGKRITAFKKPEPFLENKAEYSSGHLLYPNFFMSKTQDSGKIDEDNHGLVTQQTIVSNNPAPNSSS